MHHLNVSDTVLLFEKLSSQGTPSSVSSYKRQSTPDVCDVHIVKFGHKRSHLGVFTPK